MMEIVCVSISGLCTIIVAVIGAHSVKRDKKVAKLEEKRELRSDQRAKESMLLLKLMNANCALTVGTAMALKNGHCNGEMGEGLKAVKEAQEEYTAFHDTLALSHLSQ